MSAPIQKDTEFVHDLHTYRNGALPLAEQTFHTPAVEVLRAGYWLLRVLDHRNLSAPYWRLYWNADKGGEVLLGERIFRLLPDSVTLIAPNTPFRTKLAGQAAEKTGGNLMVGCPVTREWVLRVERSELPGAVRHLFIHFTAGTPYDTVGAAVFSWPCESAEMEMINRLTAALSADHAALGHRHSLLQLSLIHRTLARIPEETWPRHPADRRIAKTVNILHENLAATLTNADLGRRAGMSPNGLVRLFKTQTGETPHQYLRRIRVERACILLHHTDRTIEDVAETCGFCSRYHFSNVFRQLRGVGPATYRKTRLP